MPDVSISIIIPTLNEAEHISACLAALQMLRATCEIIVVDGGSSDTTVFLATSGADYILHSKSGRATQMNTGAKVAKGGILLFLHADTFLPMQATQLIHAALTHTHHWGRFDIALVGKHPVLPMIACTMNWRSRLTAIATGDQAIFVTRTAFDQIGHYSDIALMEDIDLSNKLKHISAPACLTAKVTSSARRWEQFGVFKTILFMWSLRLRFFLGVSPTKLAFLYREGIFWRI